MSKAICDNCHEVQEVARQAGRPIHKMHCRGCNCTTLQLAKWTPDGYVRIGSRVRKPRSTVRCCFCGLLVPRHYRWSRIADKPIVFFDDPKLTVHAEGSPYCAKHSVSPAADVVDHDQAAAGQQEDL